MKKGKLREGRPANQSGSKLGRVTCRRSDVQTRVVSVRFTQREILGLGRVMHDRGHHSVSAVVVQSVYDAFNVLYGPKFTARCLVERSRVEPRRRKGHVS
jgi:hypothetical protein